MTIKRIIEGKTYEFDLTGEELRNAYYEAQEQFDIEDVKSYMGNFLDFWSDFSEEQISEHIHEIAMEYRSIEEQHDWWMSADQAYRNVLM